MHYILYPHQQIRIVIPRFPDNLNQRRFRCMKAGKIVNSVTGRYIKE